MATTPSEPLLSPTHRKALAEIIDRCRRVRPRLKVLSSLGRDISTDEARIDQLIQMCEGALAIDEAYQKGELS